MSITVKTESLAYGNPVLENDLNSDNATISSHDKNAKVKADSADSAKGYLADELQAGTGIVLSVIGGDGTNKKLKIDSTVTDSEVAPPVQDIAELKAINTTNAVDWPDKIEILVEDSGLYRLDRESSDTEDIPHVVQPTVGVGRWIRVANQINSHNNLIDLQGGAVDDYQHLTSTEIADLHTHANQVQLDLITDGDHDVRTDNPHATDIGNLGSGTLAELNSKITDATLDDITGTRDPNAHTHPSSDITDLDNLPTLEILPDTLTLLSSTATQGLPTGLAIQGNFLYFVSAASAHVLEIYDISNPTTPVLISNTLVVGTSPRSIYVMGDYAFITGLDDDLRIIDISNPSSPTIVKTLAITGGNSEPWNMVGSGNYLYVVGLGSDAVHVFDISDPVNTEDIEEFDLSGVVANSAGTDIQVQGKYLYITSVDNDKLFILNASNPANLTHISNITTGDAPGCLAVSGSYAYVIIGAPGSATLEIYDISDPASPVKITTTPSVIDLEDNPICMVSSGKYLFIQTSANLKIFDIEDPTLPVELFNLALTLQRDLSVYSNLVAVTQSGFLKLYSFPVLKSGAIDVASARISNLQVTKRLIVAQQVDIVGGVTVGYNGIRSTGPVSAQGRKIDDTLTVSAARNSSNTTNVYLRSSDGLPMNIAGFVLPWNARLTAMSLIAAASASWTAEVRKNGSVTVIDSLSVVAGLKTSKGVVLSDQVEFSQNDEVQIYLNGSNIDSPHVNVVFKRI
jgi:hypothetical protein